MTTSAKPKDEQDRTSTANAGQAHRRGEVAARAFLMKSEPLAAAGAPTGMRPPHAKLMLRKAKQTPVISLGELEVREPVLGDLVDVIKGRLRADFEQESGLNSDTFIDTHEDFQDDMDLDEFQNLYHEWIHAQFLSAKGVSIEQAATEVFDTTAPEARIELSRTATVNLKRAVIGNLLKEFHADLSVWIEDHKNATASGADDLSGHDNLGTEQLARLVKDTQEAEQWERRLYGTERVLGNVRENIDEFQSADDVLMYPVDGKLAGILLGDFSLAVPKVSWFVTHPGSAGAGGALLERAVSASFAAGKNGKLTLEPVDPDARELYKEFGFTILDNGWDMQLDPSSSDQWEKIGDEWKLKKYADMKYTG